MPPRTSRLDRHRLFPLIGDERITIIRAPAGSGKTSLIVDWLSDSFNRPPTAWVMLDEQCRAAGSFWYRVIAAMVGHDIIPDRAAVARLLSGGVDPSQVPSLLIAELNTRAADLILVVDDLHLLDDAAQTQLLHVLSHAHRLRLVAASRTSTTIDRSPAAQVVGITVISHGDLAVTTAELAELSTAGLSVSDNHRLLSITRGNLLAVRLALTAIDNARDRDESTDDLISFVAGQMSKSIFASFSSDIARAQAAYLAVAPAVDAELAGAIVGERADPAQLFDMYVETGTGQMLSDGERTVFVFHPLVRAALIAHADQELNPGRVREARLTAAKHLARWGDPVDVLKLIVDSGDQDLAWSYFVQQFSIFSLHRIDDVIRVLQDVPERLLQTHGKIAAALAVELSEREARPSRRVLDLSTWALESVDRLAKTDDVVERALRHAVRLAAHRTARRYDEASAAAADLVDELSGFPPAIRERLGAGMHAAILQAVITNVLAGRFDAAIDQSALLIGDTDPGRRRHVSGLLSYVGALRGDIPTAKAHRAEIVDELASTWARTVQGVGWSFANAIIELEHGRFDAARAALAPLQYRADRFEHWPVLLWCEAYIRLLEGSTVLAYDELSVALRSHRGRIAHAVHLDGLTALHADLARAVDETRVAASILEEAPPGPAVTLAHARLRLAQGDPQEALSLVLPGRRFHSWPRRAAESHLIAGMASARLGLEARSTRSFQRAGDLLRRFELTSPLVYLTSEEFDGAAEALGAPRPTYLADPFSLRAGQLTPRELVVLRYLRSGDSLREIADRLHVSQNTVKSQVRSLYQKLGVRTRAAAVTTAREHGLL